jgi:DNA-binding NarL/FixJ family response regulator
MKFALTCCAKLAHRNLSAFNAIRRLVKNDQTNDLALSRHGQKGLVRAMLHAGASGFMLKDEAMNSCEALAQAVVDIFRKRKLPMSHSLYEKPFLPGPEIDDVPRLTKRRIEIMQAIADNPHLTLAQVADLLGIAESTLRNNLSAISRTLDTPNANGAMIECLRLGLVRIS